MSEAIDLHMHTNASDGMLTPAELLDRVRAADLVAFSITDHDTMGGYQEATKLMTGTDPELVVGLELSVTVNGDDMHMLAYLFDPDHDELAGTLEALRIERNERGYRMVEKLNEMGLNLSYDAVVQAAGGAAIGRPHVADAMVAQGLVGNFGEAFGRYIGNDGPAYLPKAKMKPKETIELVHRAGGVAVMAHPYVNEMHKQIEPLVDLGLDGLEAYHYAHSTQKVRELEKSAERFGLLLTGGSDFHGRQEHESAIGTDRVPSIYLDQLKERSLQIRGTH
jgi:hypothetical protein